MTGFSDSPELHKRLINVHAKGDELIHGFVRYEHETPYWANVLNVLQARVAKHLRKAEHPNMSEWWIGHHRPQ